MPDVNSIPAGPAAATGKDAGSGFKPSSAPNATNQPHVVIASNAGVLHLVAHADSLSHAKDIMGRAMKSGPNAERVYFAVPVAALIER